MDLFTSLKTRQELLAYGTKLVHSTKELFDDYGKDVLTASYDRFSALEKSLASKEIRMVVIGEFSRGKSSLLNALLGIDQLPVANEATTAINTFVYGLPENVTVPYLNIVFRDGHEEHIDIKSESHDELRKWGTELDTENRDPRKEVDSIDLFIDHPLLNLGLVLIDTPGLESMQKHHEEITRRAIDTAHIAIWVQSTQQLGGNTREWAFLKETIRKNFRKFLTVINMWDLILEPQDEHDKQIPAAVREKNKMNVVRNQFRNALEDVPEKEIGEMVSENNLFGVSARWALQGTPEQKEKSGLKKLSDRIQQICTGEEAKNEIFYKPMKQLKELQDKLEKHIHDKKQALETDDSLEKQKRDIENLELDIKNLEANMKLSINQAESDHERVCNDCKKNVIHDIIEPLRDLKQEIDNQISPQYVREQIINKSETINLPTNLQDAYNDTLLDIDKKWKNYRETVSTCLKELRIDYADKMNKHIGVITKTLDSLDITLPEMDVTCNIDFGNLEKFYNDKMEIQKNIESYQKQIASYEEKLAGTTVNEELLRTAKEELARAERRLKDLGPQPQAVIRQKRELVSEGGMWSDPNYCTIDVPDYAPVRDWAEQKSKLEALLNNKEKALQDIIREHEQKTGQRLTIEMGKRRLEQQIEKMQARQEAAEQKQQLELDKIVDNAHTQLLRNTSGQIDNYIRILEKNTNEGLTNVFKHQLKYLQDCVNEQFMEPLRSKKSNLEEALGLYTQGQAEIESRKRQLEEALQKLSELKNQTAECAAN